MAKELGKKIIKKNSKSRNSRSKRLMNSFLALLVFLVSSVARFLFGKRKVIFAFCVVLAISFGALYSYKYVQAKMDESNLFSDTYILEKVGSLTALPKGELPIKIVRVDDPDSLRKENQFYAKVKEGDYIIAYPKFIIIYDAIHNEIKNVIQSTKK